jgi:hypothetical protein
MEDEPDQVTFSGELAYVRHKGSDTVLMIPWKRVQAARKASPGRRLPGGPDPPGKMASPRRPTASCRPGASAVTVANYLTTRAPYYKEDGRPMGSFKTTRESPRPGGRGADPARVRSPGSTRLKPSWRATAHDDPPSTPRPWGCFPSSGGAGSPPPKPKVGSRRGSGSEGRDGRRWRSASDDIETTGARSELEGTSASSPWCSPAAGRCGGGPPNWAKGFLPGSVTHLGRRPLQSSSSPLAGVRSSAPRTS